MRTVYEFFAGGGMARLGLGPGWSCLFANDVDEKKAATYRENHGDGVLSVADIATLGADDLPGQADLAWASFPCQDLSLAGAGAGLSGARSGTVFAFWRLMADLAAQGRAPALIALENVCGAITSNEGRDFAALCGAFAEAGYRFGPLVIDAALFVAQSRPRLFLVGARGDLPLRPDVIAPGPLPRFHTPALIHAMDRLPAAARARALWWRLTAPRHAPLTLAQALEHDPADAPWRSDEQTARLISLMSPVHRAKLDQAKASGRRRVGAVYRRTRSLPDGQRLQRAEVRFDDVAGCLRTPGGGSSRQMILVVEDEAVRSRLLSARETARLMGLPDSYRLPRSYTDAYHVTGDGVVVPVVDHLARGLLEPLLNGKVRVAA
jgi:DNA (cytosine-5)-methyltransferase 1